MSTVLNGSHVEILFNDWYGGHQIITARLNYHEDGVWPTVRDTELYPEVGKLLLKTFEDSDGRLISSQITPKEWLAEFIQWYAGDYKCASALHQEDCQFEVGQIVPMRRIPNS